MNFNPKWCILLRFAQNSTEVVWLDILFKLENVRKVYRMGDERIVALDDVSLEFHRGKIYCLLGTSGSGKSTLLNMMAGLEKPTKGSIIFKGKPLERLNESQLTLYRQRYVGFVFQSYNLLPTLTAFENVMMPLTFRRVPRRKRYKQTRDMLKAVGLANRARHKPSELSGGQQQRVSIARAFVNNPDVVFADEPTGNLDTRTTAEMMDLITGIARAKNQMMIIVTHDLEISVYADYIIRIKDGAVESIVENKARMPGAGIAENAPVAESNENVLVHTASAENDDYITQNIASNPEGGNNEI